MLDITSVSGRPAVRGDLDITHAAALKAWLDQLDGGFSEVDLSGVTSFDSISLRVFLIARRTNPRVRIINPSAAVVRVLELTGTVEQLTNESALGRPR